MGKKPNPCRVCGKTPIPKMQKNGSVEIECKLHCLLIEGSWDEAIRMWNILNESDENSKRES